MSEFYQKTYQIELLTEFSSGVYSGVYNTIKKQKLDDAHILVQILEQLKIMMRTNLFNKTIEELEELKIYWQSMDYCIQQLAVV